MVRVKSPARATVDVVQVRAYLAAREEAQKHERECARQRIVETARRAARAVFPAFPKVRRAFLFGSSVRSGALRRDSDIDIAIEGRLSPEDYFALWRELERAIADRAVELVELGDALPFAERVRETGEMIYEAQDSNVESEYRG